MQQFTLQGSNLGKSDCSSGYTFCQTFEGKSGNCWINAFRKIEKFFKYLEKWGERLCNDPEISHVKFQNSTSLEKTSCRLGT